MKKDILKPKMDDSGFFRNQTKVVRVIITNEMCYPKCRVRWLIPCISPKNDIMDIDEFQKKEFYSIRVPGKFRSDYSEGYVSDLDEQEYLHEFMKEHSLQNCIVVLNYLNERRRCYLKEICDGCFGRLPECYVELLSETEPINQEYEKVLYYSYDFPDEYQLVEGSKEKLEEESEYRLMKSLHQYNKKQIIKIHELYMRIHEQMSWKKRIKTCWKNLLERFS